MTKTIVMPETDQPPPKPFALFRLIRIAIAGVLMGTANLIPGGSGGTMVLAMGIYQEFIDSVADITALRFSPRRIVFLGVLGAFALAAIVGMAKLILYLLFQYPTGMYALFVGLTLGGAPLLARSLRPIRANAIIATVIGLALMVTLLFLREGRGFPHNTAMDFVSGIVGATTMVLPGVSGSYMLLIMDQYERVVGSIDDRNLKIIAPVGIGAILGVIGLSHLLKLLLHRFAKPTIGVLLGILLGSVVGLWPFSKEPGEKALERRTPTELRSFSQKWQIPGVTESDDGSDTDENKHELATVIHQNWHLRGQSSYSPGLIALAAGLAAAGFVVTFLLARGQSAVGHGMGRKMSPDGIDSASISDH